MPVALPPSLRTSVLLGGRGVAGGVDGSSEPASTWREAMRIGRVLPSGSGAGFRADPGPILAAASALPVDEVLLRVEWARLAPSEGVLDEAEVAWMAEVLGTLHAAGRRTGIVLTDGAVPSWLGPEAWLMPATPDRLATLALALVEALPGLVDAVVPVEEPGTWCLAGWVAGAAPPLRVLATRDALAALDAMMASHLLVTDALAATTPSIEVAWLASAGVAQVAERVMLGLSGGPSGLSRAIAVMAERGPGRAAELVETSDAAPAMPVLPFGADVARPSGPVAATAWAAAQTGAPLATTVAEALGTSPGGRIGLRLQHSCATIDGRGRTSRLRGHHRLAQLHGALGDLRDQDEKVGRLILGEVTDRWRWGSFTTREGIFGVDRTRGAKGYELLTTDSSGVDVAGGLIELLAPRSA